MHKYKFIKWVSTGPVTAVISVEILTGGDVRVNKKATWTVKSQE